MQYRLWYRTGGTKDFKWMPTTTVGEDPHEVTRSGTDVRRAGYPTITIPEPRTRRLAEFEPLGMTHSPWVPPH